MIEEYFKNISKIHTRYLEEGAGEPLLLVHGGDFGQYFSADDWRPVISMLADSFYVLAPDRLGCGYTDNPLKNSDYSVEATVQHLRDFIASLGQPCHVVGHSRGGLYGSIIAIKYPELVKTLTIISSASMLAPGNLVYREWGKIASAIPDLYKRFRYLVSVNSFSEEHITTDLIDTIVDFSGIKKSVEARGKMKLGLRAVFMEDISARKQDVQSWIKSGKLTQPVLVVWGFNDPSALFEPLATQMAKLIFPNVPKSQMLILNMAGHYCFREKPFEFVSGVKEFIRIYNR